MVISSEGIVNGVILDKYGKRGSEKRFGMPTRSLPIKIEDEPKGTKSFAVIFDDPDSVPVCGFVWIHWLVANLHRRELKDDDSINAYDYLQGINGWNDNSYGGPCPPDRPHLYRIRVFALSSDLALKGGFDIDDLERKMQGKVLESAEMFGTYDN